MKFQFRFFAKNFDEKFFSELAGVSEGYVILTRASGKFSGPRVKMTYPPGHPGQTRKKNSGEIFFLQLCKLHSAQLFAAAFCSPQVLNGLCDYKGQNRNNNKCAHDK